MDVNELLAVISDVARKNDINTPYIVGGVPRDRVMGKQEDVNDIDLTTGSEDSAKLGEVLAKTLVGSKYRTYDDGHASINFKGIRLDFSNNFVVPDIETYMRKAGATKFDDMRKEIYSRDFTMNTLLEKLDFSAIYDLTGQGEEDIKAKIIRCPIDPNISIGNDARRILRAIKFSLKYNFEIAEDVKNAMLEHRSKVKSLPARFVQDKISEIVRLNNDQGIEMLMEFKLLSLVPLANDVYNILIQRHQLSNALEDEG